MLWLLGWMLQLQGNGWVSLPSEECCALGCLLKTRAVVFLTLPTAYIGLWLCVCGGGNAPRTQVFSLPIWIAAGLPAYPKDHSSLDHIAWGGSGRRLVGLGLQW